MLNLAGFGLLAWDAGSFDPGRPCVYRTTAVPVFDPNLKRLAEKLETQAFSAHVRGVPYNTDVSIDESNLHPFHRVHEIVAIVSIVRGPDVSGLIV